MCYIKVKSFYLDKLLMLSSSATKFHTYLFIEELLSLP